MILIGLGALLVFVGLLTVHASRRRPWLGLVWLAAGLLLQGLGVFRAVR